MCGGAPRGGAEGRGRWSRVCGRACHGAKIADVPGSRMGDCPPFPRPTDRWGSGAYGAPRCRRAAGGGRDRPRGRAGGVRPGAVRPRDVRAGGRPGGYMGAGATCHGGRPCPGRHRTARSAGPARRAGPQSRAGRPVVVSTRRSGRPSGRPALLRPVRFPSNRAGRRTRRADHRRPADGTACSAVSRPGVRLDRGKPPVGCPVRPTRIRPEGTWGNIPHPPSLRHPFY